MENGSLTVRWSALRCSVATVKGLTLHLVEVIFSTLPHAAHITERPSESCACVSVGRGSHLPTWLECHLGRGGVYYFYPANIGLNLL